MKNEYFKKKNELHLCSFCLQPSAWAIHFAIEHKKFRLQQKRDSIPHKNSFHTTRCLHVCTLMCVKLKRGRAWVCLRLALRHWAKIVRFLVWWGNGQCYKRGFYKDFFLQFHQIFRNTRWLSLAKTRFPHLAWWFRARALSCLGQFTNEKKYCPSARAGLLILYYR
jgi:hypothetical protein